jgi:phage-related baseplate assembly protein
MSGTIDLSQLPPPVVVEPLDFETLFNERKEAFIALYPEDEQDVIRRTLSLESEPITMLLEENCYRELLLRQRVNEAARGNGGVLRGQRSGSAGGKFQRGAPDHHAGR